MEQVKAPSKSIREYCLYCCGDSSSEVLQCVSRECPLYPYRRGKKDLTGYVGENRTPVKSIRARCVDCHGGKMAEVVRCPIKHCSLYPYRQGKAPNRQGKKFTDEQKQILAERLANSRAKKE